MEPGALGRSEEVGWVSEFRKVCQESDHRDEEGRQLLARDMELIIS